MRANQVLLSRELMGAIAKALVKDGQISRITGMSIDMCLDDAVRVNVTCLLTREQIDKVNEDLAAHGNETKPVV